MSAVRNPSWTVLSNAEDFTYRLGRELRSGLHQRHLVAIDVAYRLHNPETTVLYQVVAEQLETFLSRQRERVQRVPRLVEREFRD